MECSQRSISVVSFSRSNWKNINAGNTDITMSSTSCRQRATKMYCMARAAEELPMVPLAERDDSVNLGAVVDRERRSTDRDDDQQYADQTLNHADCEVTEQVPPVTPGA